MQIRHWKYLIKCNRLSREILKDILSQTTLHLECYQYHDKLLRSNHKKLSRKEKALQSELIDLNYSKVEIAESQSNCLLDSALMGKMQIEDQLIKYKLSIENLKADEESLLEKLSTVNSTVKIKENEIKNLTGQVQRLKSVNPQSKNIMKSNSEKRCGINKHDVKPYPISSYSLGLSIPSQKSTTLESSRSSHSHQ